jgi:predicted heme/steroid binding protein
MKNEADTHVGRVIRIRRLTCGCDRSWSSKEISEMRVFTRQELRRHTGKKKKAVYIAHWGKVYDVSRSFLSCGGTQQAIHTAGRDLTTGFIDATHGPEMLAGFPIAGVLHEDQCNHSALCDQTSRLIKHFHGTGSKRVNRWRDASSDIVPRARMIRRPRWLPLLFHTWRFL